MWERIEFIRSRPNRNSDNALVEGKNGAFVRKHIGYGHIPSSPAEQIQRFYTAYFNAYLTRQRCRVQKEYRHRG